MRKIASALGVTRKIVKRDVSRAYAALRITLDFDPLGEPARRAREHGTMTLESDIEHERRIAEQAAFWLLTLQSEDLTPEQRAELVEWLCESSRHVVGALPRLSVAARPLALQQMAADRTPARRAAAADHAARPPAQRQRPPSARAQGASRSAGSGPRRIVRGGMASHCTARSAGIRYSGGGAARDHSCGR